MFNNILFVYFYGSLQICQRTEYGLIEWSRDRFSESIISHPAASTKEEFNFKAIFISFAALEGLTSHVNRPSADGPKQHITSSEAIGL
jgi:hypothetical protein